MICYRRPLDHGHMGIIGQVFEFGQSLVLGVSLGPDPLVTLGAVLLLDLVLVQRGDAHFLPHKYAD